MNHSPPHSPDSDPAAADPQAYARLLEEARRIRGVSLWNDAWRRLRRNRAAMASLVYLVLIGVLAVFTPLLPIQAPRTVRTERSFQPPRWSPLVERTADWIDDEGRVDQVKMEAAFGKLGLFNEGLLRTRATLFGRWECGSW